MCLSLHNLDLDVSHMTRIKSGLINPVKRSFSYWEPDSSFRLRVLYFFLFFFISGCRQSVANSSRIYPSLMTARYCSDDLLLIHTHAVKNICDLILVANFLNLKFIPKMSRVLSFWKLRIGVLCVEIELLEVIYKRVLYIGRPACSTNWSC